MLKSVYSIRLESPDDATTVETLIKYVFGPGMTARAAYVLREGVSHEPTLSFVAEIDQVIVGTVRLTRINWGNDTVLMLGPLAVSPEHASLGIGKALMEAAVTESFSQAGKGGCPAIMLVGDLDYYAQFGFQRIAPDRISLPRPADPARVLACELVSGKLVTLQGEATAMLIREH